MVVTNTSEYLPNEGKCGKGIMQNGVPHAAPPPVTAMMHGASAAPVMQVL